jgi:F1F0 ATPase subunit 2
MAGPVPAVIGELAVVTLLGVLLGVAFFGSLRWVVGRLVSARRPALWMLGSLVVRIGLAMGAFVLLSQGRWDRTIAALAGFMAGRWIAIRVWGPGRANATHAR